MRIKVPKALSYRCADLVVVCGEPIIEDMQGLEVLVNPLIIFEVFSASTEVYDRGIKFFEYQSITSLQEYVLVAQDWPHITYYVRQEHGQWLRSDCHGMAEYLFLRALDCAIPAEEGAPGDDASFSHRHGSGQPSQAVHRQRCTCSQEPSMRCTDVAP